MLQAQRATVDSTCVLIQRCTKLVTKDALELGNAHVEQLLDGIDALRIELLGRALADTRQIAHRQRIQKRLHYKWVSGSRSRCIVRRLHHVPSEGSNRN
jgi:hypothetical protein